DSGQKVIVGLYPGSRSRAVAQEAGLEVADVPEVAKVADVLMMVIPDHVQGRVYREQVAPHLRPGSALMTAHGFSIHYREVAPSAEVDVLMVAPKAPGHRMRELFMEGIGVPGLLAIHQDATGHAKEIGLAYAKGIGCTRSGLLETTFKDETETDLFGEQTVLCGGITSLIQAGFETLVEAGYPPEMAYFECLHEMKLIVDLIYQGGFSYMRYSVSDTAEYGDLTRGSRVIDEHVRENMRRILKAIQDGSFAKEWIAENDEGRKRFTPLRQAGRTHQIEEVGKRLRAMMPWMNPKEV
ncbi:MAG: ketol-acid reductoisomerase, partial [Chloroflexota bacterium]